MNTESDKRSKTEPKRSWFDSLKEIKSKNRRRESVIAFLTITLAALGISNCYLINRLLNGIEEQRLILVPGIQRKMYVPAKSYLSEAWINSVVSKVVNLQENWNYRTIKSQYKFLSDWYYDDPLENRVKTNLMTTKRFKVVSDNLMVSEFEIDYSRSKFTWCKKLNRACSLVIGTRRIYVNRNDLHSKKEVAYLLMTRGVWPDNDSPFGVRFTRIKIDDSSDDPYTEVKKQYDAALKGVMPNA